MQTNNNIGLVVDAQLAAQLEAAQLAAQEEPAQLAAQQVAAQQVAAQQAAADLLAAQQVAAQQAVAQQAAQQAAVQQAAQQALARAAVAPMATATVQFDEFDVNDLEDISMRWTKWLFKIEKYMLRQRITTNEDKIIELFMHGGYDLEQLYNQYVEVNQEQPDTYQEVINKIAEHLNPKASTHLNKFKFRTIEQFDKEPFSEYVSRVRAGAKLCQFAVGTEDDECVSQIVQRCQSKALKRKALATTTRITMRQLLDMGRMDECINLQLSSIPTGEPAKVNQVSHSKQPTGKCGYCGYDLPHRTQNGECPAKGKICSKCEKPNHFSKVCRSTNNNGRDSIGNGSGGNGYGGNGGSGNHGYGRNGSGYRGNSGNGYRGNGGNGNGRYRGNSDNGQNMSGNDGNGGYSGDENGRECDNTRKTNKIEHQSDQSVWRGWSVSKSECKNMSDKVRKMFMPVVLLSMLQTFIKFEVDTGTEVDIMDEKACSTSATTSSSVAGTKWSTTNDLPMS